MSNISARGIILKKTKFSEADLILQMILADGQKLSLIARGALKSKKRFSGGVLEPTHFVQIEYKQSASGGLSTLIEAQIIDSFDGVRSDYDKTETALFCIQLINKVSQEGDVFAEGLFNLLGNMLKKISTAPADFSALQIKAVFILKLLFQQGVLETEAWMKPILSRPVSQLGATELTDQQINWCLRQIESYLS